MEKFKDINNILSSIKPGDNLSLELGCGDSKVYQHSIAIDLIAFPDVDIVGDIYEFFRIFHLILLSIFFPRMYSNI